MDVVLGASCDGVSLTGEPDAPRCGEKRDFGWTIRLAVEDVADEESGPSRSVGETGGVGEDRELIIDLRTHEVKVSF